MRTKELIYELMIFKNGATFSRYDILNAMQQYAEEYHLSELLKLNKSDVISSKLSFDEYVGDIMDELNKRFDLTTKEIDEIIDWYRYDIEDGFFGGEGYINVKTLVNSFIVDGKLKWKR